MSSSSTRPTAQRARLGGASVALSAPARGCVAHLSARAADCRCVPDGKSALFFLLNAGLPFRSMRRLPRRWAAVPSRCLPTSAQRACGLGSGLRGSVWRFTRMAAALLRDGFVDYETELVSYTRPERTVDDARVAAFELTARALARRALRNDALPAEPSPDGEHAVFASYHDGRASSRRPVEAARRCCSPRPWRMRPSPRLRGEHVVWIGRGLLGSRGRQCAAVQLGPGRVTRVPRRAVPTREPFCCSSNPGGSASRSRAGPRRC
jgi:hypothetical protein